MLTLDNIRKYRLDVYEDARAGKISDNLKNYLTTYLEGVEASYASTCRKNEVLVALESAQKENFEEFLENAVDEGEITYEQACLILGFAEDTPEFFEAADPDRIPEYVNDYLEAAACDDEAGKEIAKDKLTKAKDLGEALKSEDSGEGDSDMDLTEECANGQTIQEKLEELKINLTDDELKVVKAVDEKIQAAMQKGCDDKECDKGEAEECAESAYDKIVESANATSNLHLSVRKDLLGSYLKESVDNGLYSEEDAERVSNMIDML